jgi:hypothetical protein
MIDKKQQRFIESVRLHVAPKIQDAIILLAKAHDYARQTHCNLWDFAVDINTLKSIGLSSDDLRWLVDNGYAKCGQEVTKQDDVARKFNLARNMNFTKKTCFVVTNAALRLTTAASSEIKHRKAA